MITHSPEQTIEYARKIGAHIRGGDVIAYLGGMGAGKTTFTRGLAEGMGLGDVVTSPTFALVNEYAGKTPLYHFDMYRITSTEHLEITGFYDYMRKDTVIAVEWAENIIDALPKGTIYIKINRIDDDTREIIVDGGERFADFRD